jgi:hypothetical protein
LWIQAVRVDRQVRLLQQHPVEELGQRVDRRGRGLGPELELTAFAMRWHHHPPEEVYVVDGVFNDGIRDNPAGSFIHAPAGSSHVPQSAGGCTLFVFYPEG